MKLWSSLCFLVLAFSSTSRGQNQTTVPPGDGKEDLTAVPTPPPLLDETQTEAVNATSPATSPQSHTSANGTDVTMMGEEETPIPVDLVNKTEEVNGGVAAPTTASEGTTGSRGQGISSSSQPVLIEGPGGSSWGYVILVLIVLVIIVLCVILYFLRRVSRTYSFDLHRQIPSNHHNEPIGTFEPVYLDDLDRPAPKEEVTSTDLSPPPVSNGTAVQSEEPASSGESDPQEQAGANGLETSPTSDTSPSLGDDPADSTPSPLSSSNLFFDAAGEEQQNENNNNPSARSSDPFVEINLDEPAWCDQLLTSPGAPSSVLPFSPFSFSSSSSSSSS